MNNIIIDMEEPQEPQPQEIKKTTVRTVNTGPKGVIADYIIYKRFETELRRRMKDSGENKQVVSESEVRKLFCATQMAENQQIYGSEEESPDIESN
uniref:Uncharacterized protein n=1 Tax=Lepeophtheirus salmonis TaxID=72036 RepID=A0A0K2T990_LEPSM